LQHYSQHPSSGNNPGALPLMNGLRNCVFYIYNRTLLYRNNDMWFEGKWMQLEDIMLSEVSQDKKHKKLHVFSHTWKIDPKE
jgi:hypothetical protein